MAHPSAVRQAVDGQTSPPAHRALAATGNPYRLRPATLKDVEALERIERAAFPTMSLSTPFRKELLRGDALYLVAVRTPPGGGSPGEDRRGSGPGPALRRLLSYVFTGRSGDDPPAQEHVAGEVGIWFVLDECHIVTLATRQSERRIGVGELLLIGAVEAAVRRGSSLVTLEVRASNDAARALYRKYGFDDVGLRKRYYSDNGEDAIIMTTPPVQAVGYLERFGALVTAHATRWGEASRAIAR